MTNPADKLSMLIASPKDDPESQFNGVVQQTKGSKAYVLVDGGTAVWCDAMDVKALVGDRVRVEVRRHKGTLVANYTHPVTDDAVANVANDKATEALGKVETLEVDALKADSAVIRDLQADTAKVHNLTAEQLSATTAYVGELTAGEVTAASIIADKAKLAQVDTDQLNADHAVIEQLDSTYASIGNLNAEKARIDNLQTATADIDTIRANSAKVANLTAEELEADHATVGNLDATYASIGSLNAATARIGDIEADYLKTADMEAERARVGQLIAGKADVADLTAANARIDSLESTKADISVLESDYITADAIDTTYLHADMSNADVAWIQNGTIKDGSISNAMINSLSANKLTAGTINGETINVTNINADNITAGTINGQRIGEGSLSLDKLSEDVYTEKEVDDKLSAMQAEIDGAIETWTGTTVPTLNNSPASDWKTSDERDRHVGDVYFVVNSQSEQNGYNYRFTKSGNTYSWQLIKDSDVTNALQRLSTAEGKITTFDSDITKLKTDTGTLTTKTESLETRMSDAEDDILDKVDTTTFNEVSDTVDQHSQSITQMSQTLSNKADGSTVTALTNRVSKTEQDITGINTTIGELSTTVESKADGSTVEGVSNRLNTVSETVDGHTQSITSINSTLETKADSSTVSSLTTKVNTVSDTVEGHTQTIGSVQSAQTTMQGKLDKTVVETTQLWYSKAGTDAPTKPTSQVTSTSTNGNAWRVVVPAYNSSYPNYFYCWQWKYTDGTYGWSGVTRDIATGESQERARTAITNAAAADTKAGNAATAAATAQSTAEGAASDASKAKTDAAAAVSTANTAASDASTALSTANTANTNADTAISTANTAASDASTAKTNAATAVSTANTAKATADKNVKSSLQLWFTKANETAPNKPTSKVTSTSLSGNGWRTVVPTYSASYPYYYYCMQYELADGTYTWSDVVYDRATTENQSNSRSAVSGVSTLTTKTNEISDTVDGHTSQLSSITSTQTSIQGSAVKSTVQLWFTKANTTAPNKPTAHVTTNNASTANAWNLAVPTYNASYPYYYYCYEHQLLNDTYTWSAVTRDMATEESQSTSRSAASAAAAADTKAGNAASAAAAADTKAGNAAAAAATADGKAVSAQNTANKNVRESQQLWYTKANSTAPAKPTSKVTSTATTGGAWTTRVPTYSDSYKHYFYCMQYVAADGTVTWSDVIYDQATTEAQSVARAASADLTEFHQEYATFKQTTQQFESTVGETYATKTEISDAKTYVANAKAYYGYQYKKDIVIYGESSKYYPIYFTNVSSGSIPQTVTHEIMIRREYSEQAPSDWYTSTHKGGLNIHFGWNFGSWGGATYKCEVYEFTQMYSLMVGDVLVGADAGMFSIVYLRGGGTTGALYHIYSDVPFNRHSYMANAGVVGVDDIPYIGLEQGTKYAQSVAGDNPTYKWTVRAPLTEPNTAHLNELFTVQRTALLESRVSTAETSITQNKTDIALKANASDVYTKTATDGLISTEVTNRNAAIKESADAIKLTVSQTYTTKNELKNIDVGGRNRLLNTLNPSASKLPTPVGLSWAGPTGGTVEFSDGVTKFTSTFTSGEHYIRLNSPSHTSHALESMGIPYPCDMVFSGYYKCSFSDSAAKLAVRVQNSNGTSWLNQLPLTNLLTGRVDESGWIQINTSSSVDDWSRFEVKITVPEGVVVASAYFSFQYFATPFATGDTFEIKLMKLEKGNKATDWSPAPEDAEAAIASVESRISTAETAIEQNAADITLRATKTDIALNSKGMNLYAVANQTNGYLAGIGTSISSPDSTMLEVTSDFIPVGGASTVSIQTWVEQSRVMWMAYSFYTTKDMSTTTSRPSKTTTGTYLAFENVAVPSTANYIRVSYRSYGEGRCKVELDGLTGWSEAPADTSIYAAKAEIKVATDGISSTVSKIGGVKQLVCKYANTLPNIKTWSTYDTVQTYTVESTNDVRVGDTVYLKDTDSTRNCTVYLKGVVTAVPSTTQVTIKGRGYEDALPSDSAISSINQSAESVTIDANRVNIAGAAIFTSGRLSESSLDSNYDAKGAAQTVQNNLNNLEIGGRNLLVDSSTGNGWAYSTFDASTCEYTRSTTATGESYVTAKPMTFEAGQTYTLSCWAKSNGYVGSLDLFKVHSSGGGSHQSRARISLTTEYQRIVWTFTCDATTTETAYIRFDNNGSTTSGTEAILYIKEPKLEKGNKATDWTPAPEDLQSNAVKRTQRIWYRKSAAGAPATPGTASSNWVVKADDGSNAWTKMHVAISSTEKFIYTCEQYEMGDGTVGYTSVLLDNTITVIDGGNIITGTVTANQIAAGTITSEEIAGGTITSDNIAAGAISADRLDANALTLGNIEGLEDRLNAIDSDLSSISTETQWVHYDPDKGTVFGENGSANNLLVTGDGIDFNTSDGRAAWATNGVFHANEMEADTVEARTIVLGDWALVQSGTSFYIDYIG